ncbi:hypothetical protein GGF37_003446 [Kickxella alabastrina]|nr:hypothetical protein GGF37_003446 [Kickxella alabastrina]
MVFSSIFRPRLPFFRRPEHRQRILSSYRQLLRHAQKFTDPIEQTYLRSWIRERYHHNKRQTSPKQTQSQLSDAQWALLTMRGALAGSADQQKYIGDLAYGRTGWLKDVMQQVYEFHHPTQSCKLIRDVRPRSSQIHQPHRAYWIPLDLRAFSVPPHLLQRIADEDSKKKKLEVERRRLREQRLGREIVELTRAVNAGNPFLWDGGLVPGAFSVEPSVSRGPSYVPGVLGNPAWIPPKIKSRLDPPFVQHVRASSGCEFYRVNARKPPHWLSAKIASTYQRAASRVQRHEFYYYFIEDLLLEEEFEERLGVEDRGYWIFARNYRDFLRTRIKNFSLQPETPDVMNEEVEVLMREYEDEYSRLVAHAMEPQFRDEMS